MDNNENNVQDQVNEVSREKETKANPSNNKAPKITAVLIATILILVIGIGVGCGIWLAKNGGNGASTAEALNKMDNSATNNVTEDNSNEPEEKSYFEANKNLDFTSNQRDDINGKVAIIKRGESIFQTEKHDGYYTYKDMFSNSYDIKEITNITSEYEMTSNNGELNLFKAVVEYIDNNNNKKSFAVAVIVPKDQNQAGIAGTYDNYTGTTSFVKEFTNLYEGSREAEKSYASEYIKIIDKIETEYPNSKYDLIYFNNDNIPDLVVDGPGLNLYMYENGKVYTLMENESVGIGGSKYFDYLEKKGALYNYGNGYAGAISQVIIKVLNSKREFDEFKIISEGATLEPTDSMYEQVQKELAKSAGHYYNGKKISEEEFNNKLKESSVSSQEKDYKSLSGSKSIEEIKKQL